MEERTPRIKGLGSPEAAIAEGFLKGLEPPAPVDLLQWAQDNVIFGADDQFPGPYNPELFPFYTEILRRLQPDDPSREVTLKGSAQIGKTIVAMVFTGGCLELDPGGFMYIHPTLDNGRRWADTKWDTFIASTKNLVKLFPFERTRDAKNRTFFKRRADRRGFLQISGANSPSSLSMMTAKRQVQDDLAKWENDDNAGDPETLADSRAGSYEYDAKILKISTPLVKGACRISRAYERSDKRKWIISCPQCGHKHALEWENFKPCLSDDMDPAKAHFTCPANGCIIEQHHKAEIVNAGEWVPTQTDRARQPGYWLWRAYSPLRTWASIAEEWLKAKDSPEAEQGFYNDVLGLEYEQQGEAPPWELIAKRARAAEYPEGVIPPNALLLTIGVDIQGDRVEWKLKGFGPNQQRFTIQNGVIDGHISEQRVRDSLDMLLKRKWKNFLGRELQADCLAIDMGYETNEVRDWARRWPEAKVICVKGVGSPSAPPLSPQSEKSESGKTIKRSKRSWNLGVFGMKASLFKNLEKDDPTARGYCGFHNELPDEYFKQLCSERRVLKAKNNGTIEMSFVKLPDVRNEILDMEIYAEAAARKLNWLTADDAEWERLRAERESVPPNVQLDMLDPKVLKAKQSEMARMLVTPEKKTRGRKIRRKGITNG